MELRSVVILKEINELRAEINKNVSMETNVTTVSR